MPSQRFVVAATNNDVIATSEIRRIEVPSIVNLWGAGVTKGDSVTLLLGKTEIMPAGNMNIELSADVIDLARDGLVRNIIVGRGELRLPCRAVTTELQLHLQHEPVVPGLMNGIV